MNAARANAAAVLLADGRVLIAGGEGCSDPKRCTKVRSFDFLTSADIYNPATGKFTRTGSMIGLTQSAAAVLLPDGKVLIVGQANDWGQLYDPATGAFVRTGKATGYGFSVPITATLLRNDKVLVTGDGTAQLYDEASGKFTTISLADPPGAPLVRTSDGLPIHRAGGQTATLLPDGRVLVFVSGYLETCDPATGTCSDPGSISPSGDWYYPGATLLPDGQVLFEGGELLDPGAMTGTNTNVALLYDPSSRKVSTGSMHAARGGQTATLLPDGSALIAGGEGIDYKPLASAELFRP
jgi:hypothetical protein